jgi:uridine kinase
LNTFFVAISGPSGAGKTTLACTLAKTLSQSPTAPSVAVIQEDAYYRDQSSLSLAERLKTNYDHPSALEHVLLEQHLRCLRQGQSIEIPVYDYAQHTRAEPRIRQTAAEVVIVEGILLFSSVSLLQQFDLRVFVDTPLEHCLQRRIVRDQQERGRSRASIEEQFEKSVLPMNQHYQPIWRQHADLHIVGTLSLPLAVESILRKLRDHLAKTPTFP